MPYLERPVGQVGFSRHALPSGLPAGYGAPADTRQRVYKTTLPADPEAASMLSLDYIHGLVRDGREDPLVRQRAFQILQQAGVRERDYTGIIRAIHQWVQRHLAYIHDPAGVEFLTQARVLLDQIDRGMAFEDCDSFVLLEHALLNSVGIPTRSVIIAADRRAPDQWSHIFLEAYDNKKKRWITLDPIMKNKPIGWHPPKYFRKRVIPIADGPPFPPRTQGGQMGALPPGMTVDFLPTSQPRASVSSFYAGAVGGWHGFAGYGEEFTERPPKCIYDKDPTKQGPGPNWWDGWALHIAIQIMRAHPELRPQNMAGEQWVGHMAGIMRSQLGTDPWRGYQFAGKDPDYLWAQTRLTQLRDGLAREGSPVAAELDGALKHLEHCYAQYQAWQEWGRKELVPLQEIRKKQSELRELIEMRAEALSYVVPILDSLTPLIPLAEHHMGRIKERQKFMETVGQVAEWTGRVLTMLGPVTGGVTEVLAIAVELGNMGYQIDQAKSMASGSAATVLGNIANAFARAEELVRASEEVARMANSHALLLQAELEAAAVESPAVAEALQAETAPKRFPVVPVVAGAAGLMILAAVI